MANENMNEKRFEELLDQVRSEPSDPGAFEQSRDEVWRKIAAGGGFATPALCSGFQASMAAYRAGSLEGGKRLLLEDHVSRCAACRATLNGGATETRVVAMPAAPRRRSWAPYAIAAGAAVALLYAGRAPIDRALAGSGPRATVESASGEVFLQDGEMVRAGLTLGEAEPLRTGAGSHAVLRLRDGSRVEVNERTQVAVRAAWSGLSLDLDRGDVLLEAAKQRRGHLRVATRDTLALVKGTVFGVSAGAGGSVVSVVEGSVAVEHGGSNRLLKPGEQDGSGSPRSGGVPAAIAWSENAEKYLTLLADFAHLEKQIAAIDTGVRTQPALVTYLPAAAHIYVAAPNSSSAIAQVVALVDQRAQESAVLREWWESDGGKELRAHLTSIQAISPLLGDEIALMLVRNPGSSEDGQPLLVSRITGDPAAVDRALQQMPSPGPRTSWSVANGVLLLSDTSEHLAALRSQIGAGANSGFAADIRARYQRGVGILFGIDLEGLAASMPQSERARAGALGANEVRRLFFEQRTATQNGASLHFQGSRQGIASWLATPGTGGSAEYISSSAVLAVSASTRDPHQAFDELVSRLGAVDPQFTSSLREFEQTTGISVSADIAAALGTDFTLAVETPTAPVPGWVGVMESIRPGALETAVQRIVDAFNGHLTADQAPRKLTLGHETVNGQNWTTLKSAASLVTLYWTQDSGYLVFSTDRATAARALATRAAGTGLTRSAAFRQQLPEGSGVHHSAFVWANSKGALQGLIPAGASPALRTLLESRDPVLVTIDGETEQIRAESRTRLTSLILDLMLAGGAGHTHANAHQNVKSLHARN
ncbi:MAG: FecR domain-containing protein [Bryobacteraceae bacterium]